MKKFTSFRPRIRSRHPSHTILRARNKKLPLLKFKSVVRLGSTTSITDTETEGGTRVELNTIDAIKNSSSKLLMKTKFTEGGVITADWWQIDIDSINENGDFDLKNPVTDTIVPYEEIGFPLIAKSFFGSRNQGNTKIDNLDELEDFIEGKTLANYVFEKFYNYAREYRLHVSADGCFYTCRKMLKTDTPEEDKWYRNDDHCVWIMESNDAFDKPVNWKAIVSECVKALNAVGLDMGAVDLRVQSATNSDGEERVSPKFVVIEINSAPSFGDVTAEKYIKEIPKILQKKFELV